MESHDSVGRKDEAMSETSGDYEYDLAHEDLPVPAPTSGRTPSGEAPESAPEGPPDADGDYSYDLAHEVPQPGHGSASL